MTDLNGNRYLYLALDGFHDLEIHVLHFRTLLKLVHRQNKNIQLQCIRPGLFQLAGKRNPFSTTKAVHTGNHGYRQTTLGITNQFHVLLYRVGTNVRLDIILGLRVSITHPVTGLEHTGSLLVNLFLENRFQHHGSHSCFLHLDHLLHVGR